MFKRSGHFVNRIADIIGVNTWGSKSQFVDFTLTADNHMLLERMTIDHSCLNRFQGSPLAGYLPK